MQEGQYIVDGRDQSAPTEGGMQTKADQESGQTLIPGLRL